MTSAVIGFTGIHLPGSCMRRVHRVAVSCLGLRLWVKICTGCMAHCRLIIIHACACGGVVLFLLPPVVVYGEFCPRLRWYVFARATTRYGRPPYGCGWTKIDS